MMLPSAVWTALAAGLLWPLLPARLREGRWQWALTMIVWAVQWVTLCTGWLPSAEIDAFAKAALWLPLLWSVGAIGAGAAADRVWWTMGGLGAIACGQDWLTLVLGWEAVFIATRSVNARETASPTYALWIAGGVFLLTTGSLQLSEIASVLRHSYAAIEPELSLGRPALIVVAAACLTMLSVLSACFSFGSPRPPRDVYGLCARQVAALLFLSRMCVDVLYGLEQPLTWLLLVLAATAHVLALRTVAQPSRLDRLWSGCLYWQLAWSLTWLATMMVERTSLPGGLPQWPELGFPRAALMTELLHTVVVLTGVTSAVQLLVRQGWSPLFLEDLRGAGRDRPLWAIALLLPLASLVGVPGLWGSSQRLLLAVTIWCLPQSGPNDTLTPHYGLMLLQLIGLASWVFIAGWLLTALRTLFWEPASITWEVRRTLGSQALAIAAIIALLTAGVWASVLIVH